MPDNPITDEEIKKIIINLKDIIPRLDERVINICKIEDELSFKVEELQKQASALKGKFEMLAEINNNDSINNVKDQVTELRLEIKNLKTQSDNSEGRWKTIINFIIQIGWVIIAAYILTKMGLQAPSVP